MQISLEMPISAKWGVALKLRSQRFAMDNEVIAYQLRRLFPAYNWSLVSSGYKFNSFMAGVLHSFPNSYSKRLYTNFKCMGGIGNATSPHIAAEGQCKDSTVSAIYTGTNVWAFSFLAGVGLRYDLSDLICFTVDLDYQHVWYTMQDQFAFNGLKPGVKTDNILVYKFPSGLNTLNVSVGIGFNLR
jgi:hypothetical protein